MLQILGKAEFLNPGGSVKDRVAVRIIEEVYNSILELYPCCSDGVSYFARCVYVGPGVWITQSWWTDHGGKCRQHWNKLSYGGQSLRM